jgi:hypothetical protein
VHVQNAHIKRPAQSSQSGQVSRTPVREQIEPLLESAQKIVAAAEPPQAKPEAVSETVAEGKLPKPKRCPALIK